MLRAIALALLVTTLTQTAILPLFAREVCTDVAPSADDCAPDCAACLCCAVTRDIASELTPVIADGAVSRVALCPFGRGVPLVDPREIPHIPKA
ncbi:MAG: hypothetical protein GEV06_08935 [Luteitalea sp.]|nr:hypothetical protein [Luteitalea sp.]